MKEVIDMARRREPHGERWIKTTVEMPESEHAAVRESAAQNGFTFQQQVRYELMDSRGRWNPVKGDQHPPMPPRRLPR